MAEREAVSYVKGHEPHRGNHEGYACGFSAAHCWGCNEPWPCRASRSDQVARMSQVAARVRLTHHPVTNPMYPRPICDWDSEEWPCVTELQVREGLRRDEYDPNDRRNWSDGTQPPNALPTMDNADG